MTKRIGKLSGLFLALMLLVPAWASAHVVVTPAQAGVAQEVVFNVSVPNERQSAVTNLKLLIPDGVSEVVPSVKSGWTITTSGKEDVSSITWSGGRIPVGQRDDFSFSAQLPDSTGEVHWKAYQTYADGTVVHWDQAPNGKDDDSTGDAGPYSVTEVADDLKTAPAQGSNNTLPLGIAVAALVLSVAALLRRPKP